MKKFFVALAVALTMVFGVNKAMGAEVALAATATETADAAAQQDMMIAESILRMSLELTHAEPDYDVTLYWWTVTHNNGVTTIKTAYRDDDGTIQWEELEYTHEELMDVYRELLAAKGLAALGLLW